MRIEVTNECNLSCDYCHASPNTRRGVIPLTLVREALSKGIFTPCGNLTISGGEALLYPERTLEIVRLLKERGFFDLRIQTNGTLITQPFLDSLKAVMPEIKIRTSIDGHTEELHNRFRGASFRAVVEGTKRSIENGFNTEVFCMITSHNHHVLDEYIAFCEQLGIKKIYFRRLTGFPSITEYEAQIASDTIMQSKSNVAIKAPWYLVRGQERLCGGRATLLHDGGILCCGSISERACHISDVQRVDDLYKTPIYKRLLKSHIICPSVLYGEGRL